MRSPRKRAGKGKSTIDEAGQNVYNYLEQDGNQNARHSQVKEIHGPNAESRNPAI
jgi:hypothetical protein